MSLASDNDEHEKKASIIGIFGGLIGFMIGCVCVVISIKRQISWTPTTGEVVGTTGDCSGNSKQQQPIVSFALKNVTYTFKSIVCGRYTVGDGILVRYDPNDPDRAMDGSFFGVWGFPIVFGVVGLIICVQSYSHYLRLADRDHADFVELPSYDNISSRSSPGADRGHADFVEPFHSYGNISSRSFPGADISTERDSIPSNMGVYFGRASKIIIGLLLFMGGCLLAESVREKKMEWTPETGIVVGSEHCPYNDRGHRVIISYTVKNETYTFSGGCDDHPPKVGNRIAVRYDPNDPGSAIDDRFLSCWTWPILMCFVGFIFLSTWSQPWSADAWHIGEC